jgi:3-dehydroquinate synthase
MLAAFYYFLYNQIKEKIMKNIKVETTRTIYDVCWTTDPFEEIKAHAGKHLVVTDTNIFSLYGDQLSDLPVIVFEPGENTKNLETVKSIIDYLIIHQYSTTDAIIAFGGGVIGDIVGFTASIYKRGMCHIQIPTSLIAMVDSSIGGKTGVNHLGIKNMIGAIYQPSKVYINTGYLETLPKDEWLNGSGEILKYAILNKGIHDIVMKEQIDWDHLIERCVWLKKSYVEQDEFDNGVRMHLNLGHTYGHGIEKIHQMKHGIAVVHGIHQVIEMMDNNVMREAFAQLVDKFGMSLMEEIDIKKVEEHLRNDKKIRNGRLRLVVPVDIGKVVLHEIEIK